jgi:hypothetical protein
VKAPKPKKQKGGMHMTNCKNKSIATALKEQLSRFTHNTRLNQNIKSILVVLVAIGCTPIASKAYTVSGSIVYTDYTSTDKAAILKLFAPRIYLASGELYKPSSVEYALGYLTRYKDSATTGTSYYCYKTTETLSSPTTKLAYFSGQSSAPIYAFWVEKTSGSITYVDLVYFAFFPYNLGKTLLGTQFGNHVSDWEHVTIRCRKYSTYLNPAAVSLQHHSYFDQYSWSAMSTIGGTHIAVYSAYGSHGMWKDAGTHTYETTTIGNLQDVCSVGTTWNTWLGTVNTYEYYAASDTGTGLGTTAWASYFLTNYGSSSSQAAYYWGNMQSGSVYGYYQLVTGPLPPQSTSSLTDATTFQ